jgi:hypothetical protein
MKTFLAGLITGIVLATIGFSGFFKVLDKGVDTVKTHSFNLAK